MKTKYIAVFSVLLLINIVCWSRFFDELKYEIKKSELLMIAQELEAAVKEVDPSMKTHSLTTDTPVTYMDSHGNTIIYHILNTTYFEEVPATLSGVNTDVVTLIIDISASDSYQKCNVNQQSAILCQKGSRSYLCWTLSPQYSFVIEFSPSSVKEEEIFAMAESLHLK